jgi:PAS domain S-box-containing protein
MATRGDSGGDGARDRDGVPVHRGLGDAHSVTGALRDLEETPLPFARAQHIRQLLAELEAQRAELESQNQRLRESQAQLQESHARYADLYDFAPVAYLRMNPAGKILEANRTAASLFRIERDTLIGRPLSGLVTPSSRPVFLGHLRACFGEAIRVTNEIGVGGRSGPVQAVQITSTPLLGPDGGVVAAKTALTDVSELKRAQDVLRFLAQASATLASSFDYSSTISETIHSAVPLLGDVALVDVFDRAGVLQRIDVAVGDAQLNRLARIARDVRAPQGRRTPVEWVLQTRQPLLLPDCKATTFRDGADGFVHEPFVRACTPRSVLYVPIAARASVFGVLTLLVLQPRRLGGADVATAVDLANRIALAIENARLYEDARSAIKSRDQVLSFVSHDLKNPLMGILLSTELLLNRAPSEERRRGWRQLDRIRRGVQQMRHMVDDLLDASSIDGGRLAIDLAEYQASEVFEEALELLRPIAQDKAIELETDLRGADLKLVCDRHRLIQVLYNLIGNALKFTPRGGRVTLSTESADKELLVTIQDTGPGISPDLMPRLFQQYAQDQKVARMGRGLGLFISRGIVRAHAGRIWADPDAHPGAKFQFTLPLASHSEVARLSAEMSVQEASGDAPSAVTGGE